MVESTTSAIGSFEHFPPHTTYVEPFGGAASVLLNKDVVPVEIYNDLDTRITRLFRVLRRTEMNSAGSSLFRPTARSNSRARRRPRF